MIPESRAFQRQFCVLRGSCAGSVVTIRAVACGIKRQLPDSQESDRHPSTKKHLQMHRCAVDPVNPE